MTLDKYLIEADVVAKIRHATRFSSRRLLLACIPPVSINIFLWELERVVAGEKRGGEGGEAGGKRKKSWGEMESVSKEVGRMWRRLNTDESGGGRRGWGKRKEATTQARVKRRKRRKWGPGRCRDGDEESNNGTGRKRHSATDKNMWARC